MSTALEKRALRWMVENEILLRRMFDTKQKRNMSNLQLEFEAIVQENTVRTDHNLVPSQYPQQWKHVYVVALEAQLLPPVVLRYISRALRNYYTYDPEKAFDGVPRPAVLVAEIPQEVGFEDTLLETVSIAKKVRGFIGRLFSEENYTG